MPEAGDAAPTPTASVLLVDDDILIREGVGAALHLAGYQVTFASTGLEALARVREAIPDVVVCDVMMPDVDGFEFLTAIRADERMRGVPVILLTSRSAQVDTLAGLEMGADDYISKPFHIEEVIARVRARVHRPPLPSDEMRIDAKTGLLTERAFDQEVKRELARSRDGSRTGCLAYMYVYELPRLRERLGQRADAVLAKQLAEVASGVAPLELLGRGRGGHFGILLPEVDPDQVKTRLSALAEKIAAHRFQAGGEQLRLTPMIGFTLFRSPVDLDVLQEQALVALNRAGRDLDLQAVEYDRAMEVSVTKTETQGAPADGFRRKLRLPLQLAVTLFLSLVLPFIVYRMSDRAGFDITPYVYIVVVVALLVTAILIWAEGFAALKQDDPPKRPGAPYPPASAIIAAYLPNEAGTVVSTVEAFLALDYPAPLQVILAYNTPQTLPVEAILHEIAHRDPRFVPFRVDGSNSKAQNVNAALSEARGEFVAVYDADHQPRRDVFLRAWRWLSNGYDVVQGHCVVRNGDASWITRLVAVEFEAIYAVSHPGRARLHSFGIFGGSNGFWKAGLLSKTRLHGFMLTEDIDSSIRVVEKGYKIKFDAGLISRELAPGSLKALWNQRMRWSQGWFQVSREHLRPVLRSKRLSPRQKLGCLFLLGWREVYPWLSVQMFPIIAFWIQKYGGARGIDWLVPVFVLTTLFTLSVGPGQALFAYRLAAPEIGANRRWFWSYVLLSSVFYTEFKNLIARVAQVKELFGERDWRTTPRPQDVET